MPTFLDTYDLARVVEAYGAKPGDSSWGEESDVNKDGIIEVYDLGVMRQKLRKNR